MQINRKTNWTTFIFVIIGLLLHVVSTVEGIGCPARCTCQQKSVRCMRLQLTEIPQVPSDTNIL